MGNENEVVLQNETVELKKEEKKGYSIASLVLGLVGLVILAVPCGILAVVFSVIGRKQGGKGMAIAGLVLGIVDIVFGVINIINAMSVASYLF